MSNQQLDKSSSASYVIEHEVDKSKEAEFREWQSNIREAASQFTGYVGTDVCPPVEGDYNKWYVIVHFDSSDHLTHWVESEIRRDLIEVGKKVFSTYKITHFKTGLERWFIKQKAQPPAWKQILATLLGLYPTVMILTLGQSSISWMSVFSLADSMLLSNLASCCLLTWLVMPFVAKLLKPWLEPTDSSPVNIHWIGTLLILIALVFMRSIFNAVK
ncbi:MAG: antibiotic biosynthesis monooxygenase [Leptolyngbyaceae bacterium]|nr:antibiotic biosynthesis monooxygenase [Leptolyngbyaceae bacterium]